MCNSGDKLFIMKTATCYLCRKKGARLLFRKENYFILECLDCHFVYVDPIPTKQQLNKFYKRFDYRNSEVAELTIRKDAKNSLRRIRRHLPKNKIRLLDIGCGRGYFLDEARKFGWKVYGIDYSKAVTIYAKEKLNLNVQCIDTFKYSSTEKFDVIALNQVIEHVPYPMELIKKCFDLLNSKGIIYVATPNIDSISAKVLKEDFDHLIPPEHLGYFRKTTLTKLLKLCNFKIQYSGSWSYPVDLAGIVKRSLKRTKHSRLMVAGTAKKSANNISVIKQLKYVLFDKLFCELFYRFLNFDSFGIVLEVIARKE